VLINQEIVTLLNQHGGKAVGLTGKDGRLILSKPFSSKKWMQGLGPDHQDAAEEDYGLVGEIDAICPQILFKLQQDNFIPVIAPIGVDRKGVANNINADLVAGAVAGALKAEKLLVLTDVKGIRDADNRHLSTLSRKDMERLVKKGTIGEGMLPKVRACLTGIEAGVHKAHIIDGRIEHSVLLEIFTDKGIGTEIVA